MKKIYLFGIGLLLVGLPLLSCSLAAADDKGNNSSENQTAATESTTVKTDGTTAATEDITTPLRQWKAGTVVTAEAVRAFGIENCFQVENISDALFARMEGKSYPKGCTVPRSDLRHLKVLHVDKDGNIKIGEMVCNKAIAQDLKEIFRTLYDNRYPIERMVLIDEYNANDDLSMRDNNSSCFCYRKVMGTKNLSKHARGLAVDINTLYNPWVHTLNGKRAVDPATGAPYADRTKKFPYKIEQGDLCYRLFIAHGFRWGGAWRSSKDYQHFDK
ncbi:MAG: M15 family metallopeptidase [Prevotella sp.]|nr:M15 family metallopeptidase [Prevotella sp.]